MLVVTRYPGESVRIDVGDGESITVEINKVKVAGGWVNYAPVSLAIDAPKHMRIERVDSKQKR